VTGPNVVRRDPVGGPAGGVLPGAGPDSLHDPWGARRAENLLTSLEGILSARVVTTPLGEVSEIHILAQAGLQAKQIVRNVESALLAQLGLKVDHRKISVAQTADVRPIEALEREAVREASLKRAILFEGLTVSPAERGHRVKIEVTLSIDGQELTGREEVADTPRARVEGAARAAVAVLERSVSKHSLMLEGAKIVAELDKTVVLAVVRGMGSRESVTLTGTAEVRDNAEQAAVLAVMDATNRWVQARRAS
jgi:hypothetical protein